MNWIILIGVFAAVALIGLAAKKFGKRPPDPSIEEITKLIADFIEGKGGPYDWDDFVTLPLQNPDREKIRKECFEIYHNYPSKKKTEWCSEEGMQQLRKLYAQLSKPA